MSKQEERIKEGTQGIGEEEDVLRLLALKRYEQPPEGFVDSVVVEFRRRRMAEAIWRSRWRIWWEELVERMERLQIPPIAYGATAFAGVICAIAILNWDEVGQTRERVVQVANPAPAQVVQNTGEVIQSREQGEGMDALRLTLHQSPMEILPTMTRTVMRRVVGTMPVSYPLGNLPPAREEDWGF